MSTEAWQIEGRSVGEVGEATKLHVLVWANAAAKLEEELEARPKGEDGRVDGVDAKDEQGNTPLMLAVKLEHVDCVAALLGAGASVRQRARCRNGWAVHSEAARTRNRRLLSLVYGASLSQIDAAWQKRSKTLLEALEEVPDFQLEMQWKFQSWIPFLTRLLPHDTVRLTKVGSNVRMDSTLLGIEGLSWLRSDVSMLLYGRDSEEPGEYFGVDHSLKTAGHLRRAMTHPEPERLRSAVTRLLQNKQVETDVWSRDVRFAPRTQWLRGGGVREQIGPWDCAVYDMTNLRFTSWERPPAMRKEEAEAAERRESEAVAAAEGPEGEQGTPSEQAVPSGESFRAFQRTLDAVENAFTPTPGGSTPDAAKQDAAAVERRLLGAAGEASDGQEVQVAEEEEEEEDPVVAAAASEYALVTSENVEIAAQEADSRSVLVEAGEEVAWMFATEAHDVAFEVAFAAGPATADAEEMRPVLPWQRTAAQEAAQVGSFCAPVGGKVELRWDNSFSRFRAKKLDVVVFKRSPVPEGASPRERMSNDQLRTALRRARRREAFGGTAAEGGDAVKTISFSQYFGRPPTAEEEALGLPARSFRQPRVQHKAKSFSSVRVCMSRDFPLSVDHMLPLAEIMARSGTHFQNLNRFLNSKLPLDEGFPVEFQIPAFPTVTGTVRFSSCRLLEAREIDASFFRVPADYEMEAYVDRSLFAQV